MSRSRVHRTLPALNSVFSPFDKFPADKNHQQYIADELRTVIRKLRTSKPQAFYSMREVAQFFTVPLGTVNRSYRVLEREGILTRMRGSQTILTGLEPSHRDSIRGLIGIYIWLKSIVLLPYTQTLLTEFEERLRRSGYVADIIFHEGGGEEILPDFAERILQHYLDVLVLHSPLAQVRTNILSLRERGVRVLVIQREENKIDFPAVLYLENYRSGHEAMAAHWYKIGLRKVWLVTPPQYLHSEREIAGLRNILYQHGLESETIRDTPVELLRRVRRLKFPSAVAFLDAPHCENYCAGDPVVVEKISKICRLAFCLGAVRLSGLHSRQVRVDLVELSAVEVAAKLTADILQLSILSDGLRHTFVAQYREQVLI